MGEGPTGCFGHRTCPHTHFVVECKRCKRHTHAGVDAWPSDPIVVTCRLCGEVRRYRPSEVYLGSPDHRISRAPERATPPKHRQYRTD